MRFTTRGLTLLFTRNADLVIDGKKVMSQHTFIELINKKINEQSVWRTSNIPPKRLSVKEVVNLTAEYFHLDRADMLIKRQREWLEPRMFAAIYLRYQKHVLTSIGTAFQMNHTNILHYERQCKNLFSTDKEFHKRYLDLQHYLNSKKIKT